MTTWMTFMLQDSNSYYSDNLISFHNYTMSLMISIITFTLYIIFNIYKNKYMNLFLLKHHILEIIWTIIPMFILMSICFPSLKILYFIDEVLNPCFSIKAIGHQWYWSYEYPEFWNFEFDSYMLNYSFKNQFRLLDVDNRIVIPVKIPIRMIISSFDVIHSWTIPCLGIKVDAIPGRINQGNLHCIRPGLYFGQCSEICGMNHSFMPICVESTSFFSFSKWIIKMV